MDIFFQDPSEVPLPPSEVRIRELRAEPWQDGRKVRVYLEVDPFQKRPDAEIQITNPENEEVATASVIETITRKMELTMHLRGAKHAGDYIVSAVLFYTEQEEPEGEAQGNSEPPRQTTKVVDRATTIFSIED